MSREEIEKLLRELRNRVLEGDDEGAENIVTRLAELRVDPKRIIEEALTPAMNKAGELYEVGEYFIPELMMAAEAFKAAFNVVKPLLKTDETGGRATIIIGTVAGDIHELGKNLVATMLRIAGYNVVDLGVNVPAEKFVEEALKHGAKIIGLSALMSTTMVEQRKVIEILEKKGLRDKFKVIVGGAPVTEDWARQIGADAYGRDAFEAVRKVRMLLGEEGSA